MKRQLIIDGHALERNICAGRLGHPTTVNVGVIGLVVQMGEPIHGRHMIRGSGFRQRGDDGEFSAAAHAIFEQVHDLLGQLLANAHGNGPPDCFLGIRLNQREEPGASRCRLLNTLYLPRGTLGG